MTKTFTTTGSTSHSATVSGLTNGNTYNYYVRCRDTVGNVNTDDYRISFSIGSAAIPPPASPLACGAECRGCTNRVLATACSITYPSYGGCDGTNIINDIKLSSSTIRTGSALTVSIDYGCWPADPPEDNVALWYYNGQTWRLLKSWGPPLTNCDRIVDDSDGSLTHTFTPDPVLGTHYVRAIQGAGLVQYNPPKADSSSCPKLVWGEVEDMKFTVSTGPGTPSDALLSCSFESSRCEQGETPTTSGTTFVSGRSGQGILVDGTDRLYYSASGNIRPSEGTVMFWIKPNINWARANGYLLLDTYSVPGPTGGTGFLIWKVRNDDLIRAVLYTDIETNGIALTYPSTSFALGSWRHVAVTYGNGNSALYVDGSLVNSASYRGAITALNNNIYLGQRRSTIDYSFMQSNAVFDDFRIYGRILSGPEINNVYSGGAVKRGGFNLLGALFSFINNLIDKIVK